MLVEVETDQLKGLEQREGLHVEAVQTALNLLRIENTGLYRAADPGYPGNFSRDGLIAAELGRDYAALEAQVAYSALNQAKTHDPHNGAEPGKIHHELPSVIYRDASTAYNACDTTAQFLIGIATLHEHYDEGVIDQYSGNISAALSYIKDHIGPDYLFYERPPEGATGYALRVTYWKDSELNTDHVREPSHAIVYALAHFMNADAVLRIGSITDDQELTSLARKMYQAGIEKLWAADHFITAIDASGFVADAPSSDSLYALLHIPKLLLPEDYAYAIEEYMSKLETDAGYRSGLPHQTRDNYHTDYVWVHEQALLNAAAQKHGLGRAQQVTARVVKYIKPEENLFPELLSVEGAFAPAGNGLQLWSVRAYQYFTS